MKIKKIELFNFRNYKNAKISFDAGCSIIVGPNAIGKSSIIEAISVLGTTKSFRKAKDVDLVHFGEKNYYIQSIVENDEKNVEYKIAISFFDGIKKVSKNDNVYKKISDYLSCLFVVSFSSFDFQLINGSPNERRKFLNLLNVQLENKNVLFLNEYEQVLKERNFLLKSNKISNNNNNKNLLKILTSQLVEKGKKIISLRSQVINCINEFFENEYIKLSGTKKDIIKLVYLKNVDLEKYEEIMDASHYEDVEKGNTTRGPHKDDFCIMLNDKNISICGSQGQQRDALIALKMCVARLIVQIKKENPVLLLDDVFSELDSERQNRIVENLDKNMQTIITTTTLSDIKNEILSTASIIKLK